MKHYDRLKPYIEMDLCNCEEITKILLTYSMMTSNPLCCGKCGKEINPERISLSGQDVDRIVNWFNVANSLYLIWIASGDYEKWAKTKLRDPHGQVNKMGIELANALSLRYDVYVHYFHDADDNSLIKCPVCQSILIEWNDNYKSCKACRIVI